MSVRKKIKLGLGTKFVLLVVAILITTLGSISLYLIAKQEQF